MTVYLADSYSGYFDNIIMILTTRWPIISGDFKTHIPGYEDLNHLGVLLKTSSFILYLVSCIFFICSRYQDTMIEGNMCVHSNKILTCQDNGKFCELMRIVD